MESDPIILFAGGLAALALLYGLAARARNRRRCRWQRDRSGHRGSLIRYTCATCGQEGFAVRGKPKRCMGQHRSSGL